MNAIAFDWQGTEREALALSSAFLSLDQGRLPGTSDSTIITPVQLTITSY